MSPTTGPALLSLAELQAALREPFALEDLGASTLPLVVATLPSVVDQPPEWLTRSLDSIRAVSVGVVSSSLGAAAADLAGHFDVLLAPPDRSGEAMVPVDDVDQAIDVLAGAVTAHPQASIALVELLRIGAYASVPQGLVAESLTYSTLQAGPEFARWLAERGPMQVPPDRQPPVLTAREGTSLAITLNRPQRANAVTASMRDQLVEALRVAAIEPSIEGVVLRGSGASFCSGGDLAEFGSAPDPATGHATRLLRSPAWWVHRLARDTRAHLHGSCIGAGIELPSFAGTVIGAPDTVVRLPEIAMGLVPGAGGTVSLPRRIGRHRTAYLAITGAQLDAAEALAWGILDRVDD